MPDGTADPYVIVAKNSQNPVNIPIVDVVKTSSPYSSYVKPVTSALIIVDSVLKKRVAAGLK